jgi:hypothetical protein
MAPLAHYLGRRLPHLWPDFASLGFVAELSFAEETRAGSHLFAAFTPD